MAKISAIMLNWMRPNNVDFIVDGLLENKINDIIVWNNNADVPYKNSRAQVINTNCDMGLNTRFAAAALAQNDCLLIQDDDIDLPPATIRQLHQAWRAEPNLVHGFFGREPKPSGVYAYHLRGTQDVSVVLTRALMVHRKYIGKFFSIFPHFEEVQKRSVPYGNGEDIIFSYCVMDSTKKKNKIYDFPVEELDSKEAMNRRDWRGHCLHRTNVLQACIRWYNDRRKAVQK